MMLSDNPQVISQHHSHLVCPHCGHATIVQHGSVYSCLNCSFRRNVAEPEPKPAASTNLGVILALLALVLGVLVGSHGTGLSPRSSDYPGSPPASQILRNPLGE